MKFINNGVKKIVDIDFFKLVYMISCFFYCIPFTNAIFSKIFKLFILWGGIVFIYNYFGNKKYTLKKVDYLLFIFLIVAFISCFFNYQYNLINNIISVCYLFIQMILMLSYIQDDNLEKKLNKINKLSYIIVILTFISAILSILIYLLNVKFSYTTPSLQAIFGMFEGRLWGFYGNPNTVGHFAIISIWNSVILIFLNNYNKLKKKNYFLYFNIVIEFACLVLVNSRSSLLGILASILVFSLFFVGYENRGKNESIWKSIMHNKINTTFKVILSLLCFAFLVVFIKYSLTISSYIFRNIDLNFLSDNEISENGNLDNSQDNNEVIDNNQSPDNSQNNSEVIDNTPNPDNSQNNNEIIDNSQNSYDVEDNIVTIERDYGDSDISNGRFEIWNAGLKVFIKHPIFGVGVKNVNLFTNEYLSEETINETPNLSADLHNIFLQVLVSHGIIAFIIFVMYLVIVIIKYIVILFKTDNFNSDNTIIYKINIVNLSILISLLVINLFDSHILYFCSVFFTFAFWNTISNMNSLNDNITNKKRKELFLISNLGGGGAEKVLIDLTNNLDYKENEIEVRTIFNEGKYIKELNKNIKYSTIVKKPTILKKRIISRIIKYFPQKFVYNMFIPDNYDVEIAFLESMPAKILGESSSCATKLVWVHIDIFAFNETIKLFKSKKNLIKVFRNFDRVICVSDSVKESFLKNTQLYQNTITIYNPIDKNQILKKSNLKCDMKASKNKITMITIGRLTEQKGYLRLCEVINKLVKKFKNIELWIIGEGEDKEILEKYIFENNLDDYIKLLGFKDNPYAYLKQADLFISSSLIEGYSLVLAEAMVLGIPVLSTKTTGPDNLLDQGKYGVIVENSFEGLYSGIENILKNKEQLKEIKKKVLLRQDFFKLEDKVEEVEKLFTLKDNINKKSNLFCTVFTPTYNRAYILDKLYQSLKRQTCTEFEWVVVDDGSVDDTEKLFKKWMKENNKFKINYLKVENGGKQKAVNRGLEVANGKMFFIVDSDDHLTDDAIEKIIKYENTISNYGNYAGVAGLMSHTNNQVIGKNNKKNIIDCTSLEREIYNIVGDKSEVFYTDLLQRYKFPEIKDEKFVTECTVWDEIAYNNYKIRWFNEAIVKGDYLEDGYTNKAQSLYLKNPIGYLVYIRNQSKYYPLDLKRKMGNYYRYYEIMKDRKSIEEIANDLLTSKIFLKISINLRKVKTKIKGE